MSGPSAAGGIFHSRTRAAASGNFPVRTRFTGAFVPAALFSALTVFPAAGFFATAALFAAGFSTVELRVNTSIISDFFAPAGSDTFLFFARALSSATVSARFVSA
jgi:hypothetical protein